MWKIAVFLPLLFCHFASAEFSVPALTGPVVDPSGFLSAGASQRVAEFLHQLADRGGAQIQVAIVPSLGDLSIEEVSIKITDQWKLGKKKEDRGVLLLISREPHKVRIEVGQGLEGDLTDVTSNRIIREVIAPSLSAGLPDRAVRDGVLAIAHYTDPKLVEEAPEPHGTKRGHVHLFTILFWLFMLLIFLRPGGRGGMGGLIAYSLLGGMGGGGGSGGGGGGWSGGGGGFSGGGSSGDW